MAASSLLLDTSAKPSRSTMSSNFKRYRSAGEAISPSSTNCSTLFSPRPSMSMARRDT
ncbi:hypothetical protein D3C77_818600 [compost metagenome]